MIDLVQRHRLEGVVSKRLNSRYEAGRRSGAWVKVCLVNDAHVDKEQKANKLTWSRTANSLRELKPRKVVVDLLGRIHTADD